MRLGPPTSLTLPWHPDRSCHSSTSCMLPTPWSSLRPSYLAHRPPRHRTCGAGGPGPTLLPPFSGSTDGFSPQDHLTLDFPGETTLSPVSSSAEGCHQPRGLNTTLGQGPRSLNPQHQTLVSPQRPTRTPRGPLQAPSSANAGFSLQRHRRRALDSLLFDFAPSLTAQIQPITQSCSFVFQTYPSLDAPCPTLPSPSRVVRGTWSRLGF